MFRHTSKRRLLWAPGERFLPSALRVTTIASQRLIDALTGEVNSVKNHMYGYPTIRPSDRRRLRVSLKTLA